MKVIITETFDTTPEILFTILADVNHHPEWLEGSIEVMNIIKEPVRLGTLWEQNTRLMGKQLITYNTCHVYSKNKRFGWVMENPFQMEVLIDLQKNGNATTLSWHVSSEDSGMIQLAEPLVEKQLTEMIQNSLINLHQLSNR